MPRQHLKPLRITYWKKARPLRPNPDAPKAASKVRRRPPIVPYAPLFPKYQSITGSMEML